MTATGDTVVKVAVANLGLTLGDPASPIVNIQGRAGGW